ncbi:hypothetical protein P3L10_019161 [Capsicum annuum]
MGLGRGDVSIVDQLVEKHVTSDSFSLCYGGMDFGGGVMVLGGINPPAHKVFTKSDFDPSDMSQLAKNFPPVDMLFDDGNKLTLSPVNYLFQHFKVRGAYCLGIFPNGMNPTSLLGGIVVRHTLVTYDRENERISFWKTNCSELLDRQNSSPPPPSPSTLVVSGLDNRNSTAHMSPSPAPSGPPGYNIPDQITATNVAKECLLEALKADSKVAHIWTNLANAYYLMSDHRSSAKCLE